MVDIGSTPDSQSTQHVLSYLYAATNTTAQEETYKCPDTVSLGLLPMFFFLADKKHNRSISTGHIFLKEYKGYRIAFINMVIPSPNPNPQSHFGSIALIQHSGVYYLMVLPHDSLRLNVVITAVDTAVETGSPIINNSVDYVKGLPIFFTTLPQQMSLDIMGSLSSDELEESITTEPLCDEELVDILISTIPPPLPETHCPEPQNPQPSPLSGIQFSEPQASNCAIFWTWLLTALNACRPQCCGRNGS